MSCHEIRPASLRSIVNSLQDNVPCLLDSCGLLMPWKFWHGIAGPVITLTRKLVVAFRGDTYRSILFCTRHQSEEHCMPVKQSVVLKYAM